MKVRVAYTVIVTDEYRRAINSAVGLDGLATRKQVRAYLQHYGRSNDDELMSELTRERELSRELSQRHL